MRQGGQADLGWGVLRDEGRLKESRWAGSPCCGPGRHTAPKLSHPLSPPAPSPTETLGHTYTAG